MRVNLQRALWAANPATKNADLTFNALSVVRSNHLRGGIIPKFFYFVYVAPASRFSQFCVNDLERGISYFLVFIAYKYLTI